MKKFKIFLAILIGFILGALAALALGKLAGGGGRLVVARVDNPGAVAHRPDVGAVLEPQVGLGQQAAFFLGRVQAGNQGRGGVADGADDGAAA